MPGFYRLTVSDGLPERKGGKRSMAVPQGYKVVLEAALPSLSAALRRALMVKSARPAGYPLSGTTADQQCWQRLNRPAAYEMAKKPH
mgnify:CR=1 FL=1